MKTPFERAPKHVDYGTLERRLLIGEVDGTVPRAVAVDVQR